MSKSYNRRITKWVWDGNVILHEWVEHFDEVNDEDQIPDNVRSDEISTASLQAQLDGRPSNGPPEPGVLPLPTTWLFDPDTFAPASKIVGDKHYSIITDHLGTPLAMFDQTGENNWSMELDIYGQVRSIEGKKEDCPFRYSGQYEDTETGLYYNRFRHYDPDSGEYVSQDPVRLASGGLNLQSYVSDPTVFVDKFGLIPAFADVLDMAKNSLDFSTAKDGAVFWSGNNVTNNMKIAQDWATANGKTTLEQTAGGKMLVAMDLFNPANGLTPQEAVAVWDAASKRFAEGASGTAHVFSTGAVKMNKFGNIRTWWSVELDALMKNGSVTEIIRMKKDGTPSKIGGCKK